MISEMPALKFNIVEIWTAVIRDIHYKKKTGLKRNLVKEPALCIGE